MDIWHLEIKSPGNWYSVEIEVNSNENVINGVNHCYSFGKINDETIFSSNDFPCPKFSSPYSNPYDIISNDELPYLGGSGNDVTGTVRIRNFEWLEGGWAEWSEWGPCTLTCGSGIRTRTRTDQKLGDNESDFLACNTDPCRKLI